MIPFNFTPSVNYFSSADCFSLQFYQKKNFKPTDVLLLDETCYGMYANEIARQIRQLDIVQRSKTVKFELELGNDCPILY